MRNPFPRLENPHNSSLGLVVAVGSDALVCFFILGGGLFELDRVDFNAIFWIGEVRVEGECVGWVDIPALGVFGQGPKFGAGEGLEGTV